MAILGKRSGQGRPHNNKEELKTDEYSEGYVPVRRSIFRGIRKCLLADPEMRKDPKYNDIIKEAKVKFS
jgi:hypothetical protein